MPTLKELVNDPNTIIVDVRAGWEFESGHVPGALNIPLDEIPGRLAEFKVMEYPVIVYCRSGGRSAMAQGILQQNGITNVFNGGGLGDMQILLM
jgi:phage shock protein E